MPKPKRKKFQPPKRLDPKSFCSFCFGDGPFTELEHERDTVKLGYEILPGKTKLRLGTTKAARVLSLVKAKPASEIQIKARSCKACLPRTKREGWKPLTKSNRRAKVKA